MPRGNGTGPLGMGSMTGRRAGYCAGFDMPGYANAAPGYSFGHGRGCRGLSSGTGRRGWRTWFNATGLPGWMRFGRNGVQPTQINTTSEREALRGRADMLQAELESIRKRLDKIDASAKTR